MSARFTVHSLQQKTVLVPAYTGNGEPIQGQAAGVVIELVPTFPGRATLTHTVLTPTDAAIEAARRLFPIGGLVEMGEFTLIRGPE